MTTVTATPSALPTCCIVDRREQVGGRDDREHESGPQGVQAAPEL
jgi:hypothetical protein